jgi:hypothetical protein
MVWAVKKLVSRGEGLVGFEGHCKVGKKKLPRAGEDLSDKKDEAKTENETV